MKNLKAPSLALTVILLMPIIQLGYSYYISVAFGLFSYAFLISVKIYNRKIYFGLLLVSILFLLKSIINSTDTIGSREILIPLREMLCFLALIFISSRIKSEEVNQDVLNKVILTLLLSMLMFVVYQTYTLSTGQYFGVPIEYYVSNQETLRDVQDALFHQARFRPTSFYGEPSYTSFIVLSLLIVCFQTSKTPNSKVVYTFLALSITLVSQSLAGVLSILFVFLYWVIFSRHSNIRLMKKIAFILVFVLAVAIILFLNEEIYVRAANALAGRDESSNTRVSEPLSLLANVISSGSIFGVNYQYIEKFLGYASLDNAILRLFIYYGVLMIFPAIILLVYAGSGLLILYIILTMSFNGEFFSYDKVLIVGMVIGLSKAGLSKVRFINLLKNDRYSSPIQSSR